MRSLALSLTTLLLLALPSIAFAQGGRLAGKVTDEAGKPLADVEAKLVAVETGIEVSKMSNRKGRFSLAVVHPEYEYEIVLNKEGYMTVRAPIRLKRGEPVQGSWVMVPRSAVGGIPGLDLSPEELAAKQLAVTLYNEGARAYNANDLETAAAKFNGAIAEDPELAEAYVIGAAINWRLERYERALELTDFTLAAEANNARALGVRYDSLKALDRQDEADAALDYLIANAPEGDTAKRAYNRGLAHAKAADVESAIPRLEQAIAIRPDLAAAWGLLGDLEIARRNFQRAIECGDRLLEIEGSRERGLSLRHRAFEALGDEAGVAETLRALAEIDPDAVMNSLFERANDLFDHNEPDAAAKIYRQVLDLQPDNAGAHYKLGLALLSAEDTTTARGHLERFLELAPDHPEAPAARDMLTYLQ